MSAPEPTAPRLLSRRCATCILRPGDPMHLGPQRVREVVRANLDAGTLLTCHDTLPYGAHPEVEPAMCRGYWDAYADRTRVWQVMAALFGDHWWVEVDPPGTTPGLT